MLARHLLRKQDRLSAIELHPKDAAKLKAEFAFSKSVGPAPSTPIAPLVMPRSASRIVSSCAH